MNLNKKLLLYIGIGLIGLGIFVQALVKNFDDTFWNGFGITIFLVEVINIYRLLKYKNNENYAQKINIQNNDERNKFLSDKAKATAFYIYILIMGVGVLISGIYNYYEISQILAYSVCILVFLYWLSYLIIKKKY